MSQSDSRPAALLFRFMGAAFFLSAIIFSRTLAARFDPNPPLGDAISSAIVTAQFRLVGLGIIAIVLGELIARPNFSGPLARVFAKPIATNLLLTFVTIALPFILIEIGVRPFVIRPEEKTTSLFLRDNDLGWRMRPGTEAFWGDTPVTINAKGLRGPEIPYARTESAKRILYLGDSVTFGFMLPEYDQAYPFAVERLLEATLGTDIETINAGIGGYSPWQQRIYLEQEGLKYKPDLIILGFVLNDVTEKFNLERFGGDGVGYQLQRSYYSFETRLRYTSATYALFHRLATRLRFGSDVRKEATARELASVEDLAHHPDAPRVQEAWSVTQKSLEGIVDICHENSIPLAIASFPFTFQLESPTELNAPQQEMIAFCNAHSMPHLDLLPLIAERLDSEGQDFTHYFIDDDHLTVEGSQAVAEMIFQWLQEQPTLWTPLVTPE